MYHCTTLNALKIIYVLENVIFEGTLSSVLSLGTTMIFCFSFGGIIEGNHSCQFRCFEQLTLVEPAGLGGCILLGVEI